MEAIVGRRSSSEHDLSEYAQIFKALSDVTRQGILILLKEGPRSVNEIVSNFTLAQPTISRHLAVLRQAGLVASKRSSQHMIYRIVPENLRRCCEGFAKRFCS